MASATPDVSGVTLRMPAVEALRFIEETTSNVDMVQERVLAEILVRNADAEYLRSCGLDGATDRATFQANVPVVSYEDLQPYIQRIANGDGSPVLSTHPISRFFSSSGTSGGQCKLMPTVEDDGIRRQILDTLVMSVINLHLPGLDKGKGLYFLFAKPETRTPSGLMAGHLLTSYYKSQHFKSAYHNKHTSPTASVLCADVAQSTYAQMVCGLCQRNDVLRIGASFACSLLRVIRFLQLNWEELASDIEGGVLSERITDASVREAVSTILQLNRELAQFIRAECGKGDWAGIITRIWPNTRYLDVIVTGAMAQYVPALRYYSGGLPMVCTAYASSECCFGLNLRPLCDPSEVSYTIMPNMGYFEFLPMDHNNELTGAEESQLLIDMARVEAGHEYELVITTYAGLSRYHVGDMLRVTGFHNTAPQFQIVRRKNVLLSIAFDKTDEAELQHAVEQASTLICPHGVSVADYTSHACTKRIPGYYVIYWELVVTGSAAGGPVGKETLDACCLEMEEALSVVYRHSRVTDGSIGPLEICIVQPGTFEELMDYAVGRGASINQYKTPRCVTLPDIVELLDARMVDGPGSPLQLDEGTSWGHPTCWWRFPPLSSIFLGLVKEWFCLTHVPGVGAVNISLCAPFHF